MLPDSHTVFIMEEVCHGSGIGAALGFELSRFNKELDIHVLDLGRDFITHGSVEQLYKYVGLDGASVAEYIKEVLKVEN